MDSNDKDTTDPASDQELAMRSLQGDLSAYDEIVRRYQTMIARSLYRFCPEKADLEDLVQDTFLKGFRNLSKWKTKIPFGVWLRRVGYNLAYDRLRARKRNPLFLTVEATASDGGKKELDPSDMPDQSVAGSRGELTRTDLVRWLLERLEAQDAMILSLQYLEDLSLTEIARQTGWSISKIKVRSFRARNKLKKHLENHEGLELQFASAVG